MKREDILGLFPDATGEQVDAILNAAGADLNAAHAERDKALAEAAVNAQAKEAFDAASAERDELRKQLDEANARLAEGMSAEEIMAAREKAAEDREREFVLKSNALDAKAAFVESGFFKDEDIDALVEQVTTSDAEATAKRAALVVDTVRKARESAAEATRDELLKGNPKLGEPGAGGAASGKPTTLNDFFALPESEQIALKANDPNIISELSRQR